MKYRYTVGTTTIETSQRLYRVAGQWAFRNRIGGYRPVPPALFARLKIAELGEHDRGYCHCGAWLGMGDPEEVAPQYCGETCRVEWMRGFVAGWDAAIADEEAGLKMDRKRPDPLGDPSYAGYNGYDGWWHKHDAADLSGGNLQAFSAGYIRYVFDVTEGE